MRKQKNGSRYILRIRMGEELRQALADAAQTQDRDLSSLCRMLLREGLANQQAQLAASPEQNASTRENSEGKGS